MLRVYRYIERHPVRAGMVRSPEDYGWSSVQANLGRRFDPVVTPHPCQLALGEDAMSRSAAYSGWLRAGEDEDGLQSIRRHMAQQRAYGDSRFQAMVERALNRPAGARPPGRPATGRLDED